jgi:hypothetical protein
MIGVFAVGQVLWSLMWFFLFFVWIMLLLQVFGDIFRSDDLGGVAKFIWVLFVIVTPYLGVFVYLIVRGGKMSARQLEAASAQQAAMRNYIADAAGTTVSPSAELARLADLRDKGVIDDNEFATLKAKALQ